MFADLHVHSQYSDGTLTVGELIEKALAQNISLFSICDHNTVEAYVNEGDLCSRADIKVITGVEINSYMDGTEHHILAYGFDIHDKALNELLEYNRNIYADRDAALISGMIKDFPTLSVEEFLLYERDRRNGGWNSIDYLRSKGVVKGLPGYFDYVKKYDAKPTHKFPHPANIIKIIQNAGGYAVVAHLGESLLRGETNHGVQKWEELANQFLAIGIDGFECYYTTHTKEITEFLLDFCRKNDLIITAGSDDHGGFNNEDDGHVCDMWLGKIEVEKLTLFCRES
ncbi:MAG: PHP domain-containing protein [Firmicutes bacterium]|nr:PHP domain-containing protein [Bacillota bacterium]